MFRDFLSDKEFFKTFIKLAIPIALQNLVISSLNMVDTIMVGQLGETEIAAVGLANQIFFLLNLFMFGIVSGSAIFTAQFWGKKDVLNVRRVLGLSLMLSIAVSFLFTLLGIFAPVSTIGIFTADTQVISLGSQYLSVVAFSYIVTSITFCYNFALRSTGNARLPMLVSVVALITNTVLNYLLIFGKFGFPAMGVSGAALATVIARVLEVVILLFVVYRNNYPVAARLREMFDQSMDFVIHYLYTTIPVILNECIWSVGVSIYSVIYARMGTEVIASINIASTIERLALVLFIGMGNACAVMVGNKIGANDEDTAYVYARRFVTIGPFLGIFIGLLLVLCTGLILSVYNVSNDVIEAARRILVVFSIAMPIRIFNLIMIVGVMRSGGDTKFSLVMDTAGVWLIAIPLAYVGGITLGLPVHWVYVLVVMEEVFKFGLGVWRFLSRKWINNLVNHA